MTQQTDRDLRSELDQFDQFEPVSADAFGVAPVQAEPTAAVKALGAEDLIAGSIAEGESDIKSKAEKSFFSNFIDSATSLVTNYRGPLDKDMTLDNIARTADWAAGNVTGLSIEKMATGNVSEGTKSNVRGLTGTAGSFVGGVEQYARTLGADGIAAAAKGEKDRLSGVAESEIFRPRVQGLPEIGKEGWFNDTVDYVISKTGEGVASSVPFLAAGAVGGLPLAGAFGYTTSLGELRDELIDAGVPDDGTAAKYAYVAAVPHAILDQLTERGVLNSLTSEAKKEVTKGIVRLVLESSLKGATKEGVTEAAQRVIELGAVAHANGGEAPNAAVVAAIFADAQKGLGSTILESGVSGALPGAVFGAGEVAGQQMKPVQEARVRTPGTMTDVQPIPADTRPVAPMLDDSVPTGPAPKVKSEPAAFSEPELEAARKAIQDAAQGLPVEVTPEGAPPEEQPQEATAEPETAPLTQEDADAAVQEADQVIADAISDEELDIPAVFAEVEDYLAENEIQVDDIADEAVREIAQAVYDGEDLGVAVDRALGLEEAAPAVDPERQRRLDARAAATDSSPLDATQIGTDFRDRAKAKFETMPERDRDTSGETPEQARARRLENRAAATGSKPIAETREQRRAAQEAKYREAISRIVIDIDYTNADGEQETARVTADRALSMVDKRIQGLRELLECLG